MSQIHLKFTEALLVIASVLASSSSFASVAKNCSDVFVGKKPLVENVTAKPVMPMAVFDATATLRRISDELAEDMHPMDKADVLAKALDNTSLFTSESQIFQLWTMVMETSAQTRLREEQVGDLQVKLAQNLARLPNDKRYAGAVILLREWQPNSGKKGRKFPLTFGMVEARVEAVKSIASVDAAASKKFFEVAILRDASLSSEVRAHGIEGMLEAVYHFWPRTEDVKGPFRSDIRGLAQEVHANSMAALSGGDLLQYMQKRKKLEELLPTGM